MTSTTPSRALHEPVIHHSPEDLMLPPPPVRITRRRSLRDWLRIADAHTLWAFNPPRTRGRR